MESVFRLVLPASAAQQQDVYHSVAVAGGAAGAALQVVPLFQARTEATAALPAITQSHHAHLYNVLKSYCYCVVCRSADTSGNGELDMEEFVAAFKGKQLRICSSSSISSTRCN